MNETKIENTEKSAKMIQITGRVSQAVKDEFEQLKEDGGYETFCLFMEALLERYHNPIKINRDHESVIRQLQSEKADMQKELMKVQDMLKESQEANEAQRQTNKNLEERYEELSKVNMQQAGRLDELDGLQHKMDGHILVPVNELDMRCLEYLASRENKSRKREDITPAVFFQYAVREMLIKGNKFAIDSVPDSMIDKFKKEIANGQ